MDNEEKKAIGMVVFICALCLLYVLVQKMSAMDMPCPCPFKCKCPMFCPCRKGGICMLCGYSPQQKMIKEGFVDMFGADSTRKTNLCVSKNNSPLPVNYLMGTEQFAASIIGMFINDAAALPGTKMYPIRVHMNNGYIIPSDDSYNPMRLNVEVVNGIITAVPRFG
jgi:hypothetical protein